MIFFFKAVYSPSGSSEEIPEVKALRKLNQKNIIKLFDTFTYMNHVFLVIQYCDKGTVKELMPHGLFTQKYVMLSYFYQMLLALSHAHKIGVAHRDIKITNIFVDSSNNPILADFGLAHSFDKDPTCFEKVGTLPYRAPEEFSEDKYDPCKSDIWSMGVTFYYMLFEKEPFPSYSIDAMKEAICSGKIDFPAVTDKVVIDFISKMLTHEASKRPTSDSLLTHSIFKPEISRLKKENMEKK